MKARPAITGLALLAIIAIAPPVHAQDGSAASIRILSQTAWTTPDDPLLKIKVLVRNDGATPIDAAEIGWVLGPKIGARDEYEAALDEGPQLAAADTPVSAPDRKSGHPPRFRIQTNGGS